MSPVALSALLSILVVAVSAQSPTTDAPTPTKSQFPPTALADLRIPYNQIPYQVDTNDLLRGRQFGYNICNSTTEGPKSLCQTAFFNSIDDFCLWAPPEPNSLIADTEGEEVAWCTKPGHGTRLIPAGALKGVQFTRTPDYIQAVGFIDQQLINIKSGDYGGELDPHGADGRGNPLGGILYSNTYSTDSQPAQVIEYHNFMGGEAFCFKACDPKGPNAVHYCEHIFDRIGCAYNAPSNAKTGTFESCQGDSQDFPGVYTQNGQVMTYSQPPESLGAITSIPYTARVPASSSCTTFESAKLYTALPTPSGVSTAKTTGTAKPSGSGSGSSGTATGSAATASNTSGASTLVVSSMAILGSVFVAAFMA